MMGIGDDYLLGTDILGAVPRGTVAKPPIAASVPAAVAVAAPVAAAPRAAATTPAPAPMSAPTPRMAATVPVATTSSPWAAQVPVSEPTPAYREAASTWVPSIPTPTRVPRIDVTVVTPPARDLRTRVPSKDVASKARADATARKAASKEHILKGVDASNRLAAIGRQLAARPANRGRKPISSMGNKLASVGQRMSKKSATIVVGIAKKLLQSAVVGVDISKIATTVDPVKLADFYRRTNAINVVATMAENAGAVDILVGKLDTAQKTELANAGQAIIDRANALVTDFDAVPEGVYFPNAPIDRWTSTADSINVDATAWITQANSALGPAGVAADAAAAAVEAAAAAAAGGGAGTGGGGGGEGGGGGGEEDPFAEPGGEGGGEEQFEQPSGEEGLTERSEDLESYGRRGGGEVEVPYDDYGGVEMPYGAAREGYRARTVSPEYEGDGSYAEESASVEEAVPIEVVEVPATVDEEQPAGEGEEVSGQDQEPPFKLKSELPNVSDEAWTRFAVAMRTAPVGAVSASNALGMFELKPRRLADLDLVMNLSCMRSSNGRVIWIGEFVPPLSAKGFLNDPALQYKTFVKSMKDYVDRLKAGTIAKPDGGKPGEMSLSGVLAVLHRAGPNGLKNWNDESKRFEETQSLYSKANGIF